MKMKLQDLIVDFLRENGLKLTERYLDEERGSRPKLIRFVKGNRKYSIVFSNEDPTLHMFKEKLWTKRPSPNIAMVHGERKSRSSSYNRAKIVVDLNDRSSFKQILDFL